MYTKFFITVAGAALVVGAGSLSCQTVDLPTSKQLIGEIPGHPQRLNSLPMSIAVSPDGRYVVTVNAGWDYARNRRKRNPRNFLECGPGGEETGPIDALLVIWRNVLRQRVRGHVRNPASEDSQRDGHRA